MIEIRFTYECWEPIGEVEVIADEKGFGVLVIQEKSGDEIPFEDLRDSDQSRIRAQIIDWINHYKVMREKPFDDHGAAYVRGLNEDMGK